MIDLSFSELLLIAVVAIVVIGPKDLPHVLAKVGRWVGQGKAMVRQLRHGFDEMVRETELKEMEQRWAEHNKRIMEEHPEALDAPGEEAEQEMRPLPPPATPPPAEPSAGELVERELPLPKPDNEEDKPQ